MTAVARAVELLYPWPEGVVSCKPMPEGGGSALRRDQTHGPELIRPELTE